MSIRIVIRNIVARLLNSPVKILAFIFGIFSFTVVLISGNLPYFQSHFLTNSHWGLYDRDFWPNFLVNTNSALLDTLIIGILVFWLDKRRENREVIRAAMESISDLRYYKETDGPYRIYRNVRKLMELKFHKLDLHDCRLNELRIENLLLEGANLHGIQFNESVIDNCNFRDVVARGANFQGLKQSSCAFANCDLSRSNFSRAILTGVNFTDTRFERTSFENTILDSVVFENADFKNSKFTGASLRSANLRGCKNLTAIQLAQASNVDYIVLDANILNELRLLVPDMKISRNR